jgi:colanic acid biosynthesis glycosyl transferase WcaI
MNLKESLGLRNEFLVVHCGNMGIKQGLEVILGAADLSRWDRSLRYLIVGDGAARERLQGEVKSLMLQNVQILPLLPAEEFKELLRISDVSLVTQQKCVADIVFPSKVITLMASGRAIVASVSYTSEVARVLNEAKAGLVVPAEDPAALLAAVVALRDNYALREEIAQNARQFARNNWNGQVILSSMEAKLSLLMKGRAGKNTRRQAAWSFTRPGTSREEYLSTDRS